MSEYKTKRITSVRDIPLEDDKNDFGTQQYIDGLIEFIRYSVSPLTIALQGEWGSGKTSLMNRLYNKLCKDSKDFIGINVNTWEYSMLSTPEETIVKIMERLVKSLSEGEKQGKAMDRFSKWAKMGGGIAFRVAREAAKVAGGVAASLLIEGLVNGGPDGETPKGDDVTLAQLKEVLQEAIRSKDGKKVLVFIDDLDRLNPPVAVEILELLKNIFTLDNCIFILAIDYEVVVKGLEPKFGKLNDKNEREFRSFFDKIIQVPFSLPVNNYEPTTFLIDKLEEVGYIDKKDRNHEKYLSTKLSKIIENTVSKNPRSIKRLINSLSLINCISTMGLSVEKTMVISPDSIHGKIINFAIVALQISYPRIYNMLATQADYKKWDIYIAKRFKADVSSLEDIDWESILSAVCSNDTYLKSHESDIKDILELMSTEIAESGPYDDAGKILSEFLNRSVVTGVGGATQSYEEVNYTQIITRLHSRVVEKFKAQHPNWNFSSRKPGKNGGFKLEPVGIPLQSMLSPIELNNRRISLRITVPFAVDITHFPNIQSILDNGVKAVKDNKEVMEMIQAFDKDTTPLFCEWLEGKSLERRFFEDWNKDGKWQNQKRILKNDTTFDLTCPTAEGFDSEELINAVVKIHEAVWTLHERAKTLK